MPTFFNLTQAKVNDRRAANHLPLIKYATYVFDRAYNDYRWYYEQLHLNDNRFVGRMKCNAVFELTQTFACEGNVLEDQAIRLTSEKGKIARLNSEESALSVLKIKNKFVLISDDFKSEATVIKGFY